MTADYLRGMSDAELEVLVVELEERRELFSAAVRAQVNDELRRRRMRLVGQRKVGRR